MQRFGSDSQPTIVVDYSHTPDALQKALQALREHCQGKLWCVFGCGGDRDAGKRALMGEVAEKYSDKVIISNDNPRTESPEQIVADISLGLQEPQQVIVELDRAKAIAKAVQSAQRDDIVLIAGKGHETEQIVGDKVLPFSDSKQVQQQLELR